jgi:glutathione S-transferase
LVIEIFGHPFSSYTWKVLIALYENATPFTFRMIEDPAHKATLDSLWPLGKFPVLREGETVMIETSTIIEYLQTHHPGATTFLPADPAAALEVRMLDRVFDNHVMNVMTRPVVDALRPPERRDRARPNLSLARHAARGARMGRRRCLHAGRLRRRACALLRRLGPPDRRSLRGAEGLSRARPRPPRGGALRRGGAALSPLFPARRARPRLIPGAPHAGQHPRPQHHPLDRCPARSGLARRIRLGHGRGAIGGGRPADRATRSPPLQANAAALFNCV